MLLLKIAVAVGFLIVPEFPVAQTQISEGVRAATVMVSVGQREEGLKQLETLADDGNLSAHNVLGELYAGLGGVQRDRPRSCEHFRIAREESAGAAHNYGQCLWEGAYGQRELPEARVWYARGADQGFLQAKCALGNMLLNGEGGPIDIERGVALCREAAEAGEPNAQADMGDLYGGGQFVPQDFTVARQWYERAAAQRQRNAAFQLGVLHWNGMGGPVDLAGAGRWLEEAYDVDRKDAAKLVGRAAFIRAVPNAPAGPVDVALLAQAKRWFEIAVVEDPDPEARAEAAIMLAQLSGYERLAGETLSRPE